MGQALALGGVCGTANGKVYAQFLRPGIERHCELRRFIDSNAVASTLFSLVNSAAVSSKPSFLTSLVSGRSYKGPAKEDLKRQVQNLDFESLAEELETSGLTAGADVPMHFVLERAPPVLRKRLSCMGLTVRLVVATALLMRLAVSVPASAFTSVLTMIETRFDDTTRAYWTNEVGDSLEGPVNDDAKLSAIRTYLAGCNDEALSTHGQDVAVYFAGDGISELIIRSVVEVAKTADPKAFSLKPDDDSWARDVGIWNELLFRAIGAMNKEKKVQVPKGQFGEEDASVTAHASKDERDPVNAAEVGAPVHNVQKPPVENPSNDGTIEGGGGGAPPRASEDDAPMDRSLSPDDILHLRESIRGLGLSKDELLRYSQGAGSGSDFVAVQTYLAYGALEDLYMVEKARPETPEPPVPAEPAQIDKLLADMTTAAIGHGISSAEITQMARGSGEGLVFDLVQLCTSFRDAEGLSSLVRQAWEKEPRSHVEAGGPDREAPSEAVSQASYYPTSLDEAVSASTFEERLIARGWALSVIRSGNESRKWAVKPFA